MFARFARATTRLVVPTPTMSALAISRWLRPCTHFNRRLSLVFRMLLRRHSTPSGAPLSTVPIAASAGAHVAPSFRTRIKEPDVRDRRGV